MAAALGAVGLLCAACAAPAQAAEPMERPVLIGELSLAWGPTPDAVGLRDGLLALGYREGEDFVLAHRFTSGDPSQLPAAAADLLRNGTQILFTAADGATNAAVQATQRTPIVFSSVKDPVGLGFVDSFARPGGNVTGVASLGVALGPKRLEMFRQAVPRLRRVLLAHASTDSATQREIVPLLAAARRLQIEVRHVELASAEQARQALRDVRQGQVDGILIPNDSHWNVPGFAFEAAAREGIPSMGYGAFAAQLGSLLTYGPSYMGSGRMAARLVAKIMEGADPAEIPVEVNNDIEFVVNLKTAKALGIEIPPEVLFQADRIIR